MALSQRNRIQFSLYYNGGDKLDLSHQQLTDQDIPSLIEFLQHHQRITSLDLRHNRLTTEGTKAFDNNTKLTELYLDNEIHEIQRQLLASRISRNHELKLRKEGYWWWNRLYNSWKKLSWWDKRITTFTILSEASNIGIVINMISQWCKQILTVAGGIFGSLVYYADPLIYCFKSLVRLTRIVGREVFNAPFEEEKNGVHKYQTAADVASLTLFSFAIAFFLGAMIAPPVGITIAWCCALTGLGIVGYFDYSHQEKLAKEKYHNLVDSKAPIEEIHDAHKDYLSKRNSKRLFYGLMIGLTLLLICGSAAVFAPPALAPILYIVSKIASTYLAGIAISRFSNWAFPTFTNKITSFLSNCYHRLFPKNNENQSTPSSSPVLTPVNTHRLNIEVKRTNVATNAYEYQPLPGSPSELSMKKLGDEKIAINQVDRSLSECKATHFKLPSHQSNPFRCEAESVPHDLKRPTLMRKATA